MNPFTKFTGTNKLRVIGWILKDAKHIFDKEICNRKCHASESPHEEADWVGKVLIERGATTLGHVHPDYNDKAYENLDE